MKGGGVLLPELHAGFTLYTTDASEGTHGGRLADSSF
jgi:hypothetical protein